MNPSLVWIAFVICCLKTVPGDDHSANITSPPQSMNTTLNEVVKFNCTYVGDIVRWEANGQRIFDGQSGYEITDVPLTSTSVMSTLTVVTSLDTNNTNITCTAFAFGSETVESEPALLLLQGLLESVSNLTVILINSTTVLISWSPPFTLEGVPILGYSVTVTNTTSRENETMLVEDTTLLYSIDHPDPENNFTVTVVPINEVGAGQPATVVILNFVTATISSSTLSLPLSSRMLITNVMTSTQSFIIAPMSSTVTVTSTGTVAATGPPGLSIGIIVGAALGGLILISVILPTIVIVVICTCISRKDHIDYHSTSLLQPRVYTDSGDELISLPSTADSEMPPTCTCRYVSLEPKTSHLDQELSRTYSSVPVQPTTTTSTIDSEHELLPSEVEHLCCEGKGSASSGVYTDSPDECISLQSTTSTADSETPLLQPESVSRSPITWNGEPITSHLVQEFYKACSEQSESSSMMVVSSYSKSESSYTKQITASWPSDSTDCELVAGDTVQPIAPTTTAADSTTCTADSSTADSDQELFQSTVVFPPSQPVEQSPQSVVTLPLPHDRVKSRLAPGSNKLLPAATVTAVPVSGDQSNEYSAFVLPDSDSAVVMRSLTKIGKKKVSYLFVPKECQTQVYLLPEKDDLLSYSTSQESTNDMGGTVTVTSLQRSNSQISLVPGLAESSSTVSESVSHPFGSEDAKSKYKRLQQYQRRMFLSEMVEEEEDLLPNQLLDCSDSGNDEPENRADAVTIEELNDEDVQQIHIGGHTASVQNESIFSGSDETYPVQSSKPKETQYADLAFFKERPRAPPSMTNPVVYATISGVSREPMYGNIGEYKSLAAGKIYGVPTDKQRISIAQQVRHKWLLIGMHLGVDQAELEQITHECSGDHSLCCSELFRKWSTQEVSASFPFTWKGVIEALDNDVVRESSLARELESTHL